MTIDIDHNEFLRVLFGPDVDRAWISSGDMHGRLNTPAVQKSGYVKATRQNYFSVAAFRPHATARRGEEAERAVVFVLDDIKPGQMDGLRSLLGTPLYGLETSPDSLHVGYFLEGGITSDARYQALAAALVKLGYGDPAGHNWIRYMRLPCGVNGKPGRENFQMKLVEWNPGTSTALTPARVDTLIADAGLIAASMAVTATGTFSADMTGSRDKWIEMIEGLGWSPAPGSKAGIVEFDCPWIGEHLKDDGRRAGYLGFGRFKCFHCSHRPDAEFRDKICQEYGNEFLGSRDVSQVKGLFARRVFSGEVFSEGECDEGIGYSPAKDPVMLGGFGDWKDALDRVRWVRAQDRYFDRLSRALWTDKGFREKLRKLVPMSKMGSKGGDVEFFDQGGLAVEDITYWPGRGDIFEGPDGGLLANRWRPRTNMLPVGSVRDTDIKIWLDHLARMIPNKELRDCFLDFLTFTLRHPELKINWMMVLISISGVGKDLMLWPLKWGVGEGNCAEIKMDALSASFNGDWMESKLVVIEELSITDKRQTYEDVKPLTAAPPEYLTVSQKYMKAWKIPNLMNVISLSNHDAAMRLPPDDRRTWIVKIPPSALQDATFYGALMDFYDVHGSRDGLKKVATWLRDRAIVGLLFDPSKCPEDTEGFKEEVAYDALPDGIQWVVDQVVGGPFAGRKTVTVEEILAVANGRSRTEIQGAPVAKYHVTEGLRALQAVRYRRIKYGSRRVNLWVIPGRGVPHGASPRAVLGVWLKEAPGGDDVTAEAPEGSDDVE